MKEIVFSRRGSKLASSSIYLKNVLKKQPSYKVFLIYILIGFNIINDIVTNEEEGRKSRRLINILNTTLRGCLTIRFF